ncbi:hypothetical protein AB1E22_17710 [Buttiauxella gaviniae]|uniref:Uncharacterized protein n=1 Tax=Buttiauxella gaviniae TaxID=82990 RepID=A0ABV3NYE9_9ENTR
MSDYSYPQRDAAINRPNDEQRQIIEGQWEEVITSWVQHADARSLSLWLLRNLRAMGQHNDVHLLDEMQRWYEQPDEKLRWQIFRRAETLGFDTPAGALALSLFWSQGSMSPEGLEPVYPEPHLSTEMRRCVVLMLATRNADNPAEGTQRLLTQWLNQEKA